MVVRTIGVVLAIAGAVQAHAASANPGAGVIQELERCYEQQAAQVPYSGVVLASREGVNFHRTAGYLDSSKTVPIETDSRFRLASVQKVLTQTAIGLLAEQGKLRFDDTVGKHLSGLPAALAAATIEQLVHHRSGAASLTNLTPDIGAKIREAKTAQALVPLVAGLPASFRPGERKEYSNGGYFLLGAVIEQVSGKSYGDYLEEAVFRPLGMVGSSLAADAHTAEPISKMAEKMRLRNPGAMIPRPTMRGTPAGNGVSSAVDLAKLGSALAGDKLLLASTKAQLFHRIGDHWQIGQSGGTMGTNANLSVFPENGWVLVVLSNYDPPAGELMAQALRGVLLGVGCKTSTEKVGPIRVMRSAT